ncbi:MAG: hypothetical protein HXX18_08300 [Bacteroidetes bacterium]|nr:hypothetical protein [Bacteroidota bacterium]
MKNKSVIILLSVFITVSLFSCKSHKNGEQHVNQKLSNSQPVKQSLAAAQGVVKITAPVIIYKTNADYYNNVSVILSDDRKDIVSYPDIKDVYYNGQLAYPTRLENGYLLDNRGIGKNVAFLSYTYDEYSKLVKTPSKEELITKIISKEPLSELYICNKLPKKDIKVLNEAIKNGLSNVCENLMK